MSVPMIPNKARRWSTNFLRSAFAVALGLLLVLVLRSVAVQITPPPGPQLEPYPDISTEEKCADEGGRWILPTGQQVKSGELTRPVPAALEQPSPYCQGPLRFERERQVQEEQSQQTSLFVFALGGAIAVAGSLVVRQLKPVAPGLMLGGIVSFVIAGIHVWTLTPGIGRLITIAAVFIILVGIGVYAFRDHGDPSVTPPTTV